ncbi:hypothetical protein PoB_000346300 [Plakobranchus ocellatus]|uniref:Uncharacterized protein n=1 Tax=Plakobranchus ocellatus TaxID=259542 RepID=A0AAV3Y425_9GAST|nr:hypothetical protein PoB_000346300 [Plakobranchus ocellatus]
MGRTFLFLSDGFIVTSVVRGHLDYRGDGGTMASESALRSAWALLSRIRTPPGATWPEEGLKSLRSPCYGLALNKNQTKPFVLSAAGHNRLVNNLLISQDYRLTIT